MAGWTEADVSRLVDREIAAGKAHQASMGMPKGNDLLGNALRGGMSLGTIGQYFPNLLPAAKHRVARKKAKKSKRR